MKKMTSIMRVGALAMAGSAGFLAAYAVPASPAFFDRELADGSIVSVRTVGDEYFHFYEDGTGRRFVADPSGYLVAADASDLKAREETANKRRAASKRKINTSYPTLGKSKALVILVNFADNSFTIPDPQQTFHRMLNEEGFSEYGATGSARDYFLASSSGQFDIEFDVYGPVQLPGNMAYYGAESYRGHDSYPEEMVINACIQLDEKIDFTEYDRDGDGEIDNVYIFYAGRGQASGGNPNTIWPHSADVYSGFGKTHRFDGVLLNHYAMSNEIDASLTLSGIGTFCHEFSHVLGLPDFYATTYTSSFTCGSWSVMDYGPYNNDGHTPPIFGAYERYALKWMEPELLGEEPLTAKLAPLSEANEAYMLPTDRDNEYFIIENRQKTGWDTYIPGHGMLLWHIDYRPALWTSNSVNNDANHLYVDIVEADDTRDERSRDGDSFPGVAGVTDIDDFTTPSLRGWSKAETGKSINRIREIDGDLYFEYCGGNPPLAKVSGIELTETTPVSARIRWNAVEEADGYRISLFEIEDGERYAVNAYNDIAIDGATELTLSGLNYSTDYEFEIAAENKWYLSLKGEPFKFRTLEPTFDLLQPAMLSASEVGDDGFTLSWAPLEGAEKYEVMLFDRTVSDGEKVIADFSNGAVPEGWTADSPEFYNSTAYSGDSGAPSLKLVENGNYLQTPLFEQDIYSVSLWHRATANTEGINLKLELLDGRERTVYTENIVVTRGSAGETTTLGGNSGTDLMALHAKGVRFTLDTETTANVAVDDVTIGFAGTVSDVEILTATTPGFEDASPEWIFEGLSEATVYNCKVRGIDAEGTASAWSDALTVTTTASSGIDLPADDDNVIFYDLLGRRVSNPEKGGIYINSRREKVIF